LRLCFPLRLCVKKISGHNRIAFAIFNPYIAIHIRHNEKKSNIPVYFPVTFNNTLRTKTNGKPRKRYCCIKTKHRLRLHQLADLGTEPTNIAFNVYRTTANKTVKLNTKPLTQETIFFDTKADLSQTNTYLVKAIINGTKEQQQRFCLTCQCSCEKLSVHRITKHSGYTPNDASVGDLDGDGEYEIILHQAGRGRDNPSNGITDPPIFQAYKMDGTLLWTINLGKNIREGAHYTQFIVYDLDGDGKAEIAMKTADGTIDGSGKTHRRFNQRLARCEWKNFKRAGILYCIQRAHRCSACNNGLYSRTGILPMHGVAMAVMAVMIIMETVLTVFSQDWLISMAFIQV
jgi:hypothetical protein